jgi:hypothetical protein
MVSTYSSVSMFAGVVPLSPLPSVSFSITPISNCTLDIMYLKRDRTVQCDQCDMVCNHTTGFYCFAACKILWRNRCGDSNGVRRCILRI